MKTLKHFVVSLALLVAVLTAFTGCSLGVANEASGEKSAVCFVIANTANSQGLNLQSPLIQDTVNATIQHYGYLSVVSADGNPAVVFDGSFDIDPQYKNASKEKLALDARNKTDSFLLGLQNVIADDPEIDYMQALRLGARTLASLEGYDSKRLIVVGTGISTDGVLNFRNNLFSAQPSTIVDMLRERSELIDFSGIDVCFQHLGDVAAPQQALSGEQRSKLRTLYQTLVEAGGGTVFFSDTTAKPVNEAADYPPVTPVTLPTDTPIAFDSAQKDENAFQEPRMLDEHQVAFVADQADFLNPDTAMQHIRPIADYLKEHEEVKLLLVGCTAGDETNATSLQLSLARSESVKNALVACGVDSSRLQTVGTGSSNPWHIKGAGYEGEAAASNRKVVLLDIHSDRAQQILEAAP